MESLAVKIDMRSFQEKREASEVKFRGLQEKFLSLQKAAGSHYSSPRSQNSRLPCQSLSNQSCSALMCEHLIPLLDYCSLNMSGVSYFGLFETPPSFSYTHSTNFICFFFFLAFTIWSQYSSICPHPIPDVWILISLSLSGTSRRPTFSTLQLFSCFSTLSSMHKLLAVARELHHEIVLIRHNDFSLSLPSRAFVFSLDRKAIEVTRKSRKRGATNCVLVSYILTFACLTGALGSGKLTLIGSEDINTDFVSWSFHFFAAQFSRISRSISDQPTRFRDQSTACHLTRSELHFFSDLPSWLTLKTMI